MVKEIELAGAIDDDIINPFKDCSVSTVLYLCTFFLLTCISVCGYVNIDVLLFSSYELMIFA